MLFNKFDTPVLTGLNEDADWEACEVYEDSIYNNNDAHSEENWDSLVKSVKDVYTTYYNLYS